MRNDHALALFILTVVLTSVVNQIRSGEHNWGMTSATDAVLLETTKKIEEMETIVNTKLSQISELVAASQRVNNEEGRNALLEKAREAMLANQTTNQTIFMASQPPVSSQPVPTHSPKPKIPGEPRHVVFSTGRPQKLNKLEEVIAKNARLSMMALSRTLILYFDDNNKAIGKNQFGYPLLRDMYMHAMSLVPDADTYTYFNHDLIFNGSFVDTMDAVVYAAREGRISSRFLVVGHRTNVVWKEHMIIGKDPEEMSTWDFNGVFRSGKRFQDDAQDYFTVSPSTWDWNTIPPFVVGRTAYDNWLVHKAVMDSNVAAITASDTLGVIHQTGPAGNYQGHAGVSKADSEYNRILGKGEWWKGQLDKCQYVTYWDEHSKVQIRRRF